MAINTGGWVPGTLVHFSDLLFIVNAQSGLERIYSPDCSGNTVCSNPIVDFQQGLRMGAPRADAPACVRHPTTHGGRAQQ